MSNGTFINGKENPSGKSEDQPSVPEHKTNGNDNNQLPTPPTRSENESDDYSDAVSADSKRLTSRRRRFKRGGRKKKVEQVRSVSEFEIPGSGQRQEKDAQSEPLEDANTSGNEDYDAEEWERAKISRHSRSDQERSPRSAPKENTGIKVFNLERADSSRGARPLGISVERPKSKGKAKEDTGKKSKDSDEEDSEAEDDKSDKKKPVSIRLDLNLELEIVLKAKIKGDITITFL